MTTVNRRSAILRALDEPTRELIRLAACIAAGSESELRTAMRSAFDREVRQVWVEELVLQSYLFSGFPRALNAARQWRKVSGREAPAFDEGEDYSSSSADWRKRGEETCATVYGPMYDRLRVNIRALHPALDAWMIVEGYGKVLSRPLLDLPRRELCIISACTVSRQERQLHAHLHGAVHSGVLPEVVDATLDSIADMCTAEALERARHLWKHVRGN